MKTLKLALLIAAPLFLAACSSSPSPDDPTSSGGASWEEMRSPYGKGGGRNYFVAITPQVDQREVVVVTR